MKKGYTKENLAATVCDLICEISEYHNEILRLRKYPAEPPIEDGDGGEWELLNRQRMIDYLLHLAKRRLIGVTITEDDEGKITDIDFDEEIWDL